MSSMNVEASSIHLAHIVIPRAPYCKNFLSLGLQHLLLALLYDFNSRLSFLPVLWPCVIDRKAVTSSLKHPHDKTLPRRTGSRSISFIAPQSQRKSQTVRLPSFFARSRAIKRPYFWPAMSIGFMSLFYRKRCLYGLQRSV